jgi:hypothetical protein
MTKKTKIWEEYGVSEAVWRATAGAPRSPRYADKHLHVIDIVWASVLCEEALSDLESFPRPEDLDHAIEMGAQCFGSDRVAMRRIGRAVGVWMKSLPFEESFNQMTSSYPRLSRIVLEQVLKFAMDLSGNKDSKKLIERAIELNRKYRGTPESLEEMRDHIQRMLAHHAYVADDHENSQINGERSVEDQLYIDRSAVAGALILLEVRFGGGRDTSISNAVQELGEGYAMAEVHPRNAFEWEDFDEAQEYFENVVIREIAADALSLL